MAVGDRVRAGAEPARAARRPILLAALAGLLAQLLEAGSSRAQPPSVPPEIQATLLSKLCSYDRNFASRADDTARILIVVRPGSTESESAGLYMKGVLAKLPRFAGLSHVETIVPFASGEALAARSRRERAAVIYVAPDLDAQIAGIRSALSGIDVLSVAADPAYVRAGIVVGFDLVSGKPQILVNLAQAREQRVDFPASVLQLMQVVVR